MFFFVFKGCLELIFMYTLYFSIKQVFEFVRIILPTIEYIMYYTRVLCSNIFYDLGTVS